MLPSKAAIGGAVCLFTSGLVLLHGDSFDDSFGVPEVSIFSSVIVYPVLPVIVCFSLSFETSSVEFSFPFLN